MLKVIRKARSQCVLVLIGFSLMLPIAVCGRISKLWTFEEMFEKADLVVIAKVISTADTNQRDVLSGNINIKVVGVITQFAPRLVLKGPKEIKNIQLHHYRFEHPDDNAIENGPELVQVGRPDSTYLMFLVREKNGSYAPISGQIDPIDSVIPLLSSAE